MVKTKNLKILRRRIRTLALPTRLPRSLKLVRRSTAKSRKKVTWV
jgi:hypothetical protein